MQIPRQEITTHEVNNWQGLHLLHFDMSSCSQKVRILLGEKHLNWVSHPVNLAKQEQKTDWFRGINPNAVVPVLVHDGKVHVESNDILRYLDKTFPTAEGPWLPQADKERTRARELLNLENELHHDLRVITFSHVMPGRLMGEQFDADVIAAAAARFDQALRQLDQDLADTRYLCGDRAMLPDIAWFISVHRLVLAGYPIEDLPRLAAWYHGLLVRPGFEAEINRGGQLPHLIGHVFRSFQRVTGQNVRHRLQAQLR